MPSLSTLSAPKVWTMAGRADKPVTPPTCSEGPWEQVFMGGGDIRAWMEEAD